MRSAPKKILVMGATGILGRRVVPLLLARGHAVTAVGRSRERLARLGQQGATVTTVDMFDAAAVARVVRGHAVLVNLATHVPGTDARMLLRGAWREMDRIRREGSAILAEAAIAAGAERVVQESFALTYPDRGDAWVDEAVRPEPAKYNRSALDAEASAHRVTAAGSTGIALRFALLYGGAEDAFTRDLLRMARRGWLPMLGAPGAYLPMVTHDDAARAVVAALDAPAGTYNVVDDEPLTRAQFADAIGALLAVPTPRLPPRWLASLAGSIGDTLSRSLRLSNRALCEATGGRPVYPSARSGWRAAAQAIATTAATRFVDAA